MQFLCTVTLQTLTIPVEDKNYCDQGCYHPSEGFTNSKLPTEKLLVRSTVRPGVTFLRVPSQHGRSAETISLSPFSFSHLESTLKATCTQSSGDVPKIKTVATVPFIKPALTSLRDFTRQSLRALKRDLCF